MQARFWGLVHILSGEIPDLVGYTSRSHVEPIYFYRGSTQRLPLCRSTIAGGLDISPHMIASGSARSSWQFLAERQFETVSALIGSRSRVCASLVENVTQQYQEELIKSFGERYVPEVWAKANGVTSVKDDFNFGGLLQFPKRRTRRDVTNYPE